MIQKAEFSFEECPRFWAKVSVSDPESCWPFNGYKVNGYGRLSFNLGRGRLSIATHVAWFLWTGSPPPVGLYVCHTCDNPACVNPHHLFTGTPSENQRDCVAKRRHAFGEHNPKARLTFSDIPEIRRRLAAGDARRQIAADFGVSKSTIRQIHTGRTWRLLDEVAA